MNKNPKNVLLIEHGNIRKHIDIKKKLTNQFLCI